MAGGGRARLRIMRKGNRQEQGLGSIFNLVPDIYSQKDNTDLPNSTIGVVVHLILNFLFW